MACLRIENQRMCIHGRSLSNRHPRTIKTSKNNSVRLQSRVDETQKLTYRERVCIGAYVVVPVRMHSRTGRAKVIDWIVWANDGEQVVNFTRTFLASYTNQLFVPMQPPALLQQGE